MTTFSKSSSLTFSLASITPETSIRLCLIRLEKSFKLVFRMLCAVPKRNAAVNELSNARHARYCFEINGDCRRRLNALLYSQETLFSLGLFSLPTFYIVFLVRITYVAVNNDVESISLTKKRILVPDSFTTSLLCS